MARSTFLLAGLVVLGCGASASDVGGTGGASGGGAGGSGASISGGGSFPTDGGSGGSAGDPSTGGTGGVALACDSRFSFSVGPPVQAGQAFVAKFTDASPHTYVAMSVSGPGAPTTTYKDVVQGGGYTWRYDVAGHAAGVLSFEFRKDVNGGPGTLLGSCQIESQGSGGSGGAPSGGGGAPSGGGGTSSGGSAGNFAPSCPTTCPSVGPSSYPSSPTVGAPTTDHPPPLHGDLNVKLRGWEPCSKVGCQPKGDVIGYVYYPPDSVGVDAKAPRLHTLFSPAAAPFFQNYRMYDWNWSCGQHGCKGGLVSGAWEVTAVTFTTTPGQSLRLPLSGYEIATGGLQARALYVDGDSVTLKYTGEDNVVVGYTLSIVGICPAPALRSKYAADDSAGRAQLPALHGGDVIGTACGSATLVTIRDSGTFMDPRSESDWWQGHP